jgi:hypothetical protein
MPQGVLPIQYEIDPKLRGLTALGGLLLYLELAHVAGMVEAVRNNLSIRAHGDGWSDVQIVMALILLNLAGGSAVDDIERLGEDEGFVEILRRAQLHHLPRHERRELLRAWRKGQRLSVPSQTAVLRYLKEFHDEGQEKSRVPGKAFIPTPNQHLRELVEVHRAFVGFVQKRQSCETATLDTDATLVATHKASAQFSYKGFKAYQPLNVWWAEQGLILHTEFRDGNVPAGFEILRVVQEALDLLPEGVKKVRVRSDTAAYQHEFLQWMADEAQHPKWGVIDFAVGCDVTPSFKKAVAEVGESDWKWIYQEDEGGYQTRTKRQWAEVCFVPNEMVKSGRNKVLRFLATRELLEEQALPGQDEQYQQALPFPTVTCAAKRYKVFGVVTDLKESDGWTGEKVIGWLYERCGKSEEAHAVMKEDLAGGKLPSQLFGSNAAWWSVMVLAHNLNAAMKRLVLGEGWGTRRLKSIRYHLINLAGWVHGHSRRLWIRLGGAATATLAMIVRARARMRELAASP